MPINVKNGYQHVADFLGGVLKFNWRKTGPRNIRAVGVLSYAKSALQLGFKADIELAIKVNASGVLADVVQAVPQLQSLFGLFSGGEKK